MPSPVVASASPRPSHSRRELLLLLLLLAVAALPRFWGLGVLSLQVDEGVQGLAVEGWLRTGLPILPSGAVYQRAIPFVALQAVTADWLGLNEFALRLPAALFGVAAVAVVFALASALFGRRVGWLAAVFIALSAWEIELSRYARFYTAFQVSYVLALLCLFRGLAPGAWRWRVGFVVSALVAVTMHELAIALATCFLIPFLDRTSSWRTRLTSIAAMMAFVVVWRVYRRGAGPWLASLAPPHGLEPVFNADAGEAGARLIRGIPAIRLPDIAPLREVLSHPTPALFALVAIVAVLVTVVVREGGASGWRRTLVLVVAMACGVTHQFMLAGLVLLAYMAWFATGLREVWSRPLWPVLASVAISLSYWMFILSQRLGGDWKGIILTLFGFPNVLQHFVYWFAVGWPVFLLVVTVAAVAMLGSYLAHGNRSHLLVPAAIVLPVVAASLFQSYQESRYVFHVYPLLVILFSWGVVHVAERIASAVGNGVGRTISIGTLLATCLVMTRDVGPLTWAPMTRTYDSPRDPMRSVISWAAYAGFHQDQSSPAQFVRQQSGGPEGVAAIGVPHQLVVYRFYLGRLDVALSRPEDTDYQRMRNGRRVDWVTGAEVVFDPAELAKRLPGGTGWLLGDQAILRDDVAYFPEQVKRDARGVAGDVRHWGRDDMTFAAKIP